MFIYRLHLNALLAIDVSLETSDPDEHRPLCFEAVPMQEGLPHIDDILDSVRDEVGSLTGVQGHLLGRTTTPADLHAAMKELNRYAPELRQGHAIVANHVPEPTPPGTAS